MKIIYLLNILGMSSAFPVVFHTSSKAEADGRIYYPNTVSLLRVSNPKLITFRSDLFQSPDISTAVDDRIYFRDSDESHDTRFNYARPTEPLLPSIYSPKLRFRHSLVPEEQLHPFSENHSGEGSANDVPEVAESTEKSETRIPLSFLEQWAKENSNVPTSTWSTHDQNDGKSNIIFMTTEPPVSVDDDTETDKSVSFQSLFQVPKLSKGQRKVCPPNQRKNHHGKCITPIRIFIIENDDSDEKS